jgi:aryl-alcohol dehydrogenase-like predicted oxidoreductase
VGKILYVGVSDTPAWVVAHANTLAELRGWSPFVALQMQYSLVERGIERELLPMAQNRDLAVAAWSPLAFGVLTGKYERGAKPSTEQGRLGIEAMGEAYLTDRNFDIVDVVREIATESDATPAQVALAWLRQRPGVVIPIVGARKAHQIRDNIEATNLDLSPEQQRRLDDVSAIDRGFPYVFMNTPGARDAAFGNTYPLVDDHRRARSGRGEEFDRSSITKEGEADERSR